MGSVFFAAAAVLLRGACAFELGYDNNAVAHELHRRAGHSTTTQHRDQTVGAKISWDPASAVSYLNFTVGTPPQSLGMEISTTDTNFWMAESRSPSSLGWFDDTRSTSFVPVAHGGDFNLSTGGTTVVGILGTDTVNVVGADTTLNDFTIAVATTDLSRVSGSVGLAPRTSDVENGTDSNSPSLIEALYTTGNIGAYAFSMYTDGFDGGALLFGGIDTAKFSGDLALLDVQPDSGDYRVLLTGLSFSTGDTEKASPIPLGGSDGIPASIDADQPYLALPADAAKAVYRGLGIGYDETAGYIPCNANVNGYTLNFTFGAFDIGVPLRNFILPHYDGYGLDPINGELACILAISMLSGDQNTAVILGAPFLRGVYVLFDIANNQVGMAPSIPQATDSNVVALAGTTMSNATPTVVSSAPSNTVPSATTVSSQFLFTQSALPTLPIQPSSPLTSTIPPSAGPTFDGVPSSGLGTVSSTAANATHTKKAAATCVRASWSASLLASVAVVLAVAAWP